MRRNLEGCENIEILPFGMWKEKAELHFDSSGGSGSRLSDSGDQTISVDSIDNLCAGERITFIKMDIEGSEQAALRGAEAVIRRDRPRLAICIYHSPRDLFEIPLWIKKTVPEYKLYIRQHSDNASETVLYATL